MASLKRGYRDVERARALGNRIRERAHQLDMSYTQLARKSELPYKTLMNYLDGKRTPDPFTLGRIAASLETSPEALQTERPLLLSVEPELYAAQTSLHQSLPQLWADDLLLINELIMCMQARRSERAAGVSFDRVVFDTLQRIYREVIPRIIQECGPARLSAYYDATEAGQIQFRISCAFRQAKDIPLYCEKIGDYLRKRFKLAKNKLRVGDAPGFDMQFSFLVGSAGGEAGNPARR